MNLYEMAALVGAAAWLPQIANRLYWWQVKPEINLVTGPAPEIGYTTFGPILNLSCAFSVKKKPTLIEKVDVELAHERGQATKLVWVTLNETLSVTRSLTGASTEHVKSQTAIALRVDVFRLTEKLVSFQNEDFLKGSRTVINNVDSFQNHQKRANLDHAQTTLDSREYADLLQFVREQFCWQPGSYTATVKIYLSEIKIPSTKVIHFLLSSDEVDLLKENIDMIEQYTTALIKGELKDFGKDVEKWNWVYPQIS